MITVCVLGGNGNIGRALSQFLETDTSLEISSPTIDQFLTGKDHFDLVFYCIGMTSDFRDHPYRTVEAHIEILSKVLQTSRFERLVYLSSVRVYKHSSSTQEDASINVYPSEGDSIYNLSKLSGESLCLLTFPEKTRIARISNVVTNQLNPNTFIGYLSRSQAEGRIQLTSSLNSEKDYVDIETVVHCLHSIGLYSKEKIYNVASGYNLKSIEIIEAMKSEFGVNYHLTSDETRIDSFPLIDISRISEEFNFNIPENSTMIQKIVHSMKELNHGN